MDFNEYVKSRGYKSGDFIPKTVANQLHESWLKESGNQSGSKTVSRQSTPEDEAAKVAMIQASLGAFGLKKEEAARRGVEIPQNVASSIEQLISVGKFKEASDIQNQVLGAPPTIEEQKTKAGLEAEKAKQEQEERQKIKDVQLVYAGLKREQSELEKIQKQDISDVVGFSEPVARVGRRIAGDLGAKWAQENELLRKKLIMQTTSDIFEQARKIAPVTNTDLNWLKNVVVPSETDDSSIWFEFLKGKKEVIDEKLAQIESDPELSNKIKIKKLEQGGNTQGQPQSASDRLRAKRQQNGN